MAACQIKYNTHSLLQNPLTAALMTSIVAAVLGSLQIGYHTGNVNAPARVSRTGET